MKIHLQHQLSVALENQPGRLARMASVLAEHGIHIEALCVIDNVEQGMVRMMTSDPVAARAAAEAEGFPAVEAEVLVVLTTDRLGRLATIAQALAVGGINIEYAYASIDHLGAQTRLVLKTSHPRRALEILHALPEN